MDINQYEELQYDQMLDDLIKWCEQGRLFLKCEKTFIHNNEVQFVADELYKVADVVDEYGNAYLYLDKFGDKFCISLYSDDFELVIKNNV